MNEETSDAGPESEDSQNVEDQSEKLEAEIARLEKELQYSAAEIANVRQRAARDKSEAIRFGASGLSRKMLPLLGSLDKAISNFDDSSSEAFLDGVKMTLEGIKRALESEGVVQIEAVGMQFDPTCMEAIATVSAPEGVEPGSVVEVMEEGYLLHERVLRAARVIVAEASGDESAN